MWTKRNSHLLPLGIQTSPTFREVKMAVFQKARNRSSRWLGSPGPYPEDSKSAYRKRARVYCSAPHSCAVDPSWVSVSWAAEKGCVDYAQGMVFSHGDERSCMAVRETDATGDNHTKLIKACWETQMVYVCSHLWFLLKRRIETIWGAKGAKGRGEEREWWGGRGTVFNIHTWEKLKKQTNSSRLI